MKVTRLDKLAKLRLGISRNSLFSDNRQSKATA
jgi:hypothetical protein